MPQLMPCAPFHRRSVALGSCAGAVLLALAWLEVRLLFAQEEPNHAEQLAIYDLNLARADPPGYARSVGLGALLDDVEPKPPLAVNPYLVSSARFRASEMASHNYFAHQSEVTGAWPNDIVRDAGYPLDPGFRDEANQLESIAAGFRSFQAAFRALIEDVGFDPPGHRIHLLGLEPFWRAHREIGVGYAYRSSSSFGHYYAYHTGKRGSSRAFITGVVYADRNGNGRYDYGEGVGGVTIRVSGASNAEVISMHGGGYAVRTSADGVHVLEASGPGFDGEAVATVMVSGDNVAVDFVSGRREAQVNFEGVPTAAGSTVILASSDDSSCGAHAHTGAGLTVQALAVAVLLLAGLRMRRSTSSWRRDVPM